MISQNLGQGSREFLDDASQSADAAINSGKRMANDALDQLQNKMDDVRSNPTVRRVADQAETLAPRGAEALRDSTAQLRDKAARVSDDTVGYIKDEPVKSILIAAAAGAALMALIGLLGRAGDR